MGGVDMKSKGGGIYEPNMTPLIDVSLVLVVILMVATPMAYQSSISVRTADSSGKSAAKKVDADRVEVEVTDRGVLKVNRVEVSPETFAATLKERLAASQSRMVVVHCNDAVPHGLMVTVLDEARGAGAATVALAEK